jgi:catechol 2,3-dioxygenase-like lactoylglutathione lyase family enzyme
MTQERKTEPNVTQTVPFLSVSDMEASIRYYVDGLGFEVQHKWVVEGKLRWCWLQRGGGALMLQQYPTKGHDSWVPEGQVGEGVAIYFQCRDALAIYHEVTARGIVVETPFVGNAMWVIGLSDPDGYQLYFESDTNVPEGTEYTATSG